MEIPIFKLQNAKSNPEVNQIQYYIMLTLCEAHVSSVRLVRIQIANQET